MAFENGFAGKTKGERTALDRMSGWDNSEDVTINAADLVLTAGVTGDGNAGVGGGQKRENYYAYGIHNPGSSAVTIKYNDIKGGSSKVFTLGIPAGGWAQPLVRLTTIKGSGSGTTAATIKIMYKDRFAIDGTGALQGIVE
jgi:hypothetical protein